MFTRHPILSIQVLVLILVCGTFYFSSARADQSATTPRIQLAILLDTSNSMDGLIDQTRNQLWQVVNEFASARQNGVTPILEIALYEYGNDRLSRDTGFIRQLHGFTRELDQISQALFSLTTSGGNEYCGFAIRSALADLQWSPGAGDIKTIFIAGNEPFTQGPVDFREAVETAARMGVAVNTVYAGDYNSGIAEGWRSGALLASGDYMSIDHNIQVVHFDAPQDERIAELNAALNATYLPYGTQGTARQKIQQEQDQQSSEIAPGLLSQRVRSKASPFYDNSSWDLVDAFGQGKVDADRLADLEEAELPKSMRSIEPQKRIEYLQEREAERGRIQQEIQRLSRERDAFVATQRAEQPDPPNLGDALIESVRKQAEAKDFEFID